MAVEEPTNTTPVAAVEVTKQDGNDGKIIRQVEYYFSDVNLSKDKFMQEEIQKDEGWMSLETLVKFNRLKQLSSDYAVIISALKKSTNDLLEIDEENNRVRRSKPLPENPTEFETTLKLNTVYAKGFPESLTLDDLISYFEQYGKVLQVHMRRVPLSKAFKGSVFVTFSTKEETDKFMELPEVKYEETTLERETQEAYLTRKAPQFARMKEDKEKRANEKEAKKKEREEAEAAFYMSQKVEGSVLHFKNVPAEGTREKLKEIFDSFAKIRWVDYTKGDAEGYLRFVEANKGAMAVEEAKKANDGKITLAGVELEVRVLEGEEEEKFWKDTIAKLVESRKTKPSRRSARNGGGRGDWKRNNDNKRANEDGESNENKKVKTEDE